ncbi:site-specific integrase [Pedobacter sp. UBA4863]|uniref:site-specific integrase n=1 Tax=Pedobacter sp. UBA4863 TaxID=1947060 RepID=UPI0025F296E1|nr:site-specific integrase [Pedobacter sp. UBA4863]
MLEKSYGLLFFLKQPKNQNEDLRFVYLRITVDGKAKELSTKRKWDQTKWNQATGRAIGTKEDAKALNSYLDALALKINEAKRKLIENSKQVTAQFLVDYLNGTEEKGRLIIQAFKDHNSKMELLVGTEYAPGTFIRYTTACEHLQKFIEWKYCCDDINIKDLDYEFISNYEFWLKGIRNCAHNTAMKYISNFKKIVLEALKKGWILRDPFLGFKTTKREVIRTALTQQEINRIKNKKFAIDRIGQIADMFLFSCYTGLAYIDLKQLRIDQIITGIDKQKWIITTRQKTDTATRLPLLPTALEIVNKYRDHPYCIETGAVLPVPSNQKLNAYLKEIADICGITKTLTFHIARHTFATTVTLSNGVPIETVSRMLGHSSIKQTQHYAKILDTKISQDMKALRKRLGHIG